MTFGFVVLMCAFGLLDFMFGWIELNEHFHPSNTNKAFSSH